MFNMSEDSSNSNSSNKLEVEVGETDAEGVVATAVAAATAVAVSSSSSSNANDNDNGTQPPNSGCNYLNKKWIVGTVLVIVVVATVLGVTIGTSTTTSSNAPTAKCNGEHLVEVMEEGNGNAAPEGIRRLITDADTTYLSIGCFRTQDNPGKHPLMAITQDEKAKECHSSCQPSYFGIADSTCYCYSDPPQDRLSIGSCHFTENPCVEDDQK